MDGLGESWGSSTVSEGVSVAPNAGTASTEDGGGARDMGGAGVGRLDAGRLGRKAISWATRSPAGSSSWMLTVDAGQAY